MFNRFWARFSKQTGVRQQRIADLQDMDDIEIDDDERTEMFDTLAYHQPSKEAVVNKARRLTKGASR